MKIVSRLTLILAAPLLLLASCSKPAPEPSAATAPAKHEHHAPHNGTPVVLGNEAYHLELVVDATAGKLQAYVLDGEMENFVRCALPALEITGTIAGQTQTLALKAVPNAATGETVGDTSLFEGQADWLKTTAKFDATLKTITVRGTTFSDVKFNFPKGNDDDTKK
jgi:hypothetical protein